MGADAFVAFYGVRYTLSEDECDAVERRTDPRVTVARRTRLDSHLGRLTDGEPHYLLIGTSLGIFGVENETSRSVDAPEIERIMRDTAATLSEAGLTGTPQLHLQLEAQY